MATQGGGSAGGSTGGSGGPKSDVYTIFLPSGILLETNVTDTSAGQGSSGSSLVKRKLESITGREEHKKKNTQDLLDEVMAKVKEQGDDHTSVRCLFREKFEELRSDIGLVEVEFIESLRDCKDWNAQGGKTDTLFAKTGDDRYIIKAVKKEEFFSFEIFGQQYLEHMQSNLEPGQHCLVKIFGMFEVTNSKGHESHLMVMENVFHARDISVTYDLKGLFNKRSNPRVPGGTLLDANFAADIRKGLLKFDDSIKSLFKKVLNRDTKFLSNNNLMDYSLLIGVDHKAQEVVCAVIDYLGPYTWKRTLESVVKSMSGVEPTVVPPQDYQVRLMEFINNHF